MKYVKQHILQVNGHDWLRKNQNENVCLQQHSNPQPLASQTGALCIVHIKIYDRAIKSLSVSRPIHPVGLSQIGKRRAFTLKICTHMGSSTDNRVTFWESGRPSADYGTTGQRQIVRPWLVSRRDSTKWITRAFDSGLLKQNNRILW